MKNLKQLDNNMSCLIANLDNLTIRPNNNNTKNARINKLLS
jgi:hypothetical protein